MRQRICILDLPSPFSMAWREALSARASEIGFTYLEIWGEAATPLEDDLDYLIVSGDVAGALPVQPTLWLVLYSPPAETLQALSEHGDHAFWLAASRLAMGASAIQDGGGSLDSRAPVLDIPGLGPVRRREVSTSPPPTGVETLAFYDSLPPAPGAKAVWPAEFFTGPATKEGVGTPIGDAPLQLAGRRRILAHAPFIELCPGEWRIRLWVKVDPQMSPSILRFEWGHGDDVAFVEHRFDRPGRYELTLDRVWRSVIPVRMVIWAQRPTFDGTLWIESAEVEYMRAPEFLSGARTET